MNKISVVHNNTENFLVNHDHWLETIPFAVIVQIFIKCVISTCLSDKTVYKSHFLTYLKHKSYEHCLIFAIPVIGAIIGAIVYFVVFPSKGIPTVNRNYVVYSCTNNLIDKSGYINDQYNNYYKNDKSIDEEVLKYNYNFQTSLKKDPEYYGKRLQENLFPYSTDKNLLEQVIGGINPNEKLKLSSEIAAKLVLYDDKYLNRLDNSILNDEKFWNCLFNSNQLPHNDKKTVENRTIALTFIENKNLCKHYVMDLYYGKIFIKIWGIQDNLLGSDTELFLKIIERDDDFLKRIGHPYQLNKFEFTKELYHKHFDNIVKCLKIYGNLIIKILEFVKFEHLADLILIVEEKSPENMFSENLFGSQFMPYDFDFWMTLIKRRKNYILDIFNGLKVDEFLSDLSKQVEINKGIEVDILNMIQLLDDEVNLTKLWNVLGVLTEDVEFIKRAVERNPKVYKLIKDKFKKDPQIIIFAARSIENHKDLLYHCDKALFKNDDFIIELSSQSIGLFTTILHDYSHKLRTKNEFEKLIYQWCKKSEYSLYEFGGCLKYYQSIFYLINRCDRLITTQVDEKLINEIPQTEIDNFYSSEKFIDFFSNIIAFYLDENSKRIDSFLNTDSTGIVLLLRNNILMDSVLNKMKQVYAKSQLRKKLGEINRDPDLPYRNVAHSYTLNSDNTNFVDVIVKDFKD